MKYSSTYQSNDLFEYTTVSGLLENYKIRKFNGIEMNNVYYPTNDNQVFENGASSIKQLVKVNDHIFTNLFAKFKKLFKK